MLAPTEKIIPLLASVQKRSAELNLNSSAAWLKDLRQNGLTRFLSLGIPTTKEEDWRYTNLSVLTANDFAPLTKATLTQQEQIQKICTKNEITVVLVNGTLDKSLSSLDNLPAGLTILPLQRAFSEKESELRSLLEKYDNKTASSFIALNNALTADGIYIQVANKAIIEKLIHVIHVTQNKENGFTTPTTFITLEKSTEATIMETHLGVDLSTYLSAPLSNILLNENAILHYCKAQHESLNAFHIGNTRVWQEQNSNFDGFSLMNGAAITRNDLDIISNGEGTSSTLNGFYGVNGHQHVDNHSSMDHREPNCTSDQLYKGILNGESHCAFNGKIFVRKIAQKTNSYQLNKNLILGINCRVDTKPQLEIFADDVKCTHGATIGQLNEDEIFYLQTRGISKKDAVKLLAHGFVQDILNKIHNPAIIEKLNILLQPTFAALE